jgi:hypothetical protein
MLGHLLEKYQWVEPRHDLIAEALWLLADPKGYKNNVGKTIREALHEETLKKLKTEQSTKGISSVTDKSESNAGRKLGKRTLNKPKKNFFGR